jgi:ketosteroid isomerase-like protein
MAVKEKAGDVVMRAKRRIGIENPSAADDSGNVGIVRGALRAFGEGNTDEFLDVLREDVTWEGPGGDFPGGESLSGRDEVREQFVDNVGRTFTEFGFVPESFLDADDDNAVVVFGRFVGEGAEGAGLDVPAVQVWAFKGSEADLVRIYTDSAEFPEVITEEKQKKREEEEKKEKEEAEAEADDDSEGESDDDSESKSDESSESKSEDQTDSKSDDDSESKSEDDSESKSDDDSESKSEDDSDSEKSS